MEVNHVMSDSHMEGRSIQGKYTPTVVLWKSKILGEACLEERQKTRKSYAFLSNSAKRLTEGSMFMALRDLARSWKLWEGKQIVSFKG